jgi:BirA family transcriptional regulator, biotin operon repressor / biotin---[acetyl-CoA-carboxylase] ligase
VDWSWSNALRDPRCRDVVSAASVVTEIVHRGTVRSTQDEALALLRERTRTGMLVVADRQVAGRGRRGRTWEDAQDAGASLALTLVIATPDAGSTLVPHAVGLALHDAIGAIGVTGVALKWPNDLVVPAEAAAGRTGPERRRKVAGILVEREQLGDADLLLIGIGVNIGCESRPLQPLHPDRTSLHELSPGLTAGASIDRVGFLAALVGALDTRLSGLARDRVTLMVDYRARCETIGRDVDLELPGPTTLHGRAVDVDEDGHLILDVAGAQHVVVAATLR